jgi:Rieske Fe-S protein
VCPHLGCAVAYDPKAAHYRCPCHDSAFDASGNRIAGPAERGLDTLATTVDPQSRRVSIAWVRYRQGGTEKVPT